MIMIQVYKEKKQKHFRIVILPTGRNEMGLIQVKDYGIISYLSIKEIYKMGEFILWALNQSDNEIIKDKSEVEFSKKFFNYNSYRKITIDYNLINIKIVNNVCKLELLNKDGYGFTSFKDKDGNFLEYEFKKKPTAYELGSKLMEMFEYKENYDEI
ncbi:osmolarity sensor protein EnvZ [Leptotrichia sp. OH3620_COT-345]|uniref:osmolarity sensor protein EnvZ n=1 Tax=Leptotrichia sp. OH3620_COT-345 TaxID=2491048 RepID=UPI000F648446|nr:osmolarity sensor protein EnvZ [Leptotrichia sp. OH3620_COT-345]RRD37150.1 osmolarity sensor protein EnvZ [Leptotrichia sp. OH3620_COT-345]